MVFEVAAPALYLVKNCHKSEKYVKYRRITEGFYSEIQYKKVKLYCTSEIVRHSCIVQNSISHLDLQLPKVPLSNAAYFEIPCSYNGLLNTEEKCQKFHCRERSLLYKLNLDLPKGREWSLKSKSLPKYSNPNTTKLESTSIAEISIDPDFYFNLLSNFFRHACEKIGPNEKLLRWFMKLIIRNDSYFFPRTLTCILDCIHGDLIEAEFVKKCLASLDLKLWIETDGKPERLGNLLYQLRRTSSRSERNSLKCDQLDHFFLHPSFLYTGQVLKFLNAPHLCKRFVYLLKSEIVRNSGRHTSRYLVRIVQGKSLRRRALLLMLYWTFIHRSKNPVSCSESLRLVWNSVSDAFIVYDELASEFKFFLPQKIDDIYQFYSTSVDDYSEKVEPRSLQQYCRSSIRKELWKSGQWLPHAIEQLGLPTKLQSYLKLENHFSR